jgi:hypothetical protein
MIAARSSARKRSVWAIRNLRRPAPGAGSAGWRRGGGGGGGGRGGGGGFVREAAGGGRGPGPRELGARALAVPPNRCAPRGGRRALPPFINPLPRPGPPGPPAGPTVELLVAGRQRELPVPRRPRQDAPDTVQRAALRGNVCVHFERGAQQEDQDRGPHEGGRDGEAHGVAL